jgi:hypothetical protein
MATERQKRKIELKSQDNEGRTTVSPKLIKPMIKQKNPVSTASKVSQSTTGLKSEKLNGEIISPMPITIGADTNILIKQPISITKTLDEILNIIKNTDQTVRYDLIIQKIGHIGTSLELLKYLGKLDDIVKIENTLGQIVEYITSNDEKLTEFGNKIDHINNSNAIDNKLDTIINDIFNKLNENDLKINRILNTDNKLEFEEINNKLNKVAEHSDSIIKSYTKKSGVLDTLTIDINDIKNSVNILNKKEVNIDLSGLNDKIDNMYKYIKEDINTDLSLVNTKIDKINIRTSDNGEGNHYNELKDIIGKLNLGNGKDNTKELNEMKESINKIGIKDNTKELNEIKDSIGKIGIKDNSKELNEIKESIGKIGIKDNSKELQEIKESIDKINTKDNSFNSDEIKEIFNKINIIDTGSIINILKDIKESITKGNVRTRDSSDKGEDILYNFDQLDEIKDSIKNLKLGSGTKELDEIKESIKNIKLGDNSLELGEIKEALGKINIKDNTKELSEIKEIISNIKLEGLGAMISDMQKNLIEKDNKINTKIDGISTSGKGISTELISMKKDIDVINTNLNNLLSWANSITPLLNSLTKK